MSVISFAQAKELILARLRETMAAIPVSEREKARYIVQMKPLSILDLIRECQQETDIGKRYIVDQAKILGYVIS